MNKFPIQMLGETATRVMSETSSPTEDGEKKPKLECRIWSTMYSTCHKQTTSHRHIYLCS